MNEENLSCKRSIMISKSNIYAKIIHLSFLISVLLIITVLQYSTVFAIEITNFNNKYSGITGVIYTDNILFYSNSAGVFGLNQETGEITSYKFENNRNYFSFTTFFEYKNEIYLFKTGDSLYCIRDGYLKSITSNIVKYYITDDALYIMKSSVQRIEIITGTESISFDLEEKGFYNIGYFCEIKNEIYAYMAFNGTGNRLLFKINKEHEIEILINQNHLQYQLFKSELCYGIYNINDELWLKYYDKFLKYDNNELSLIDDMYGLNSSYIYSMVFNNENIYGINQKGIFKTNINSKQTSFFKAFDIPYSSKITIEILNDSVYFFDGVNIYIHNLKSLEFSRFDANSDEPIKKFIFDKSRNLIILFETQIKMYNPEKPMIYGPNTVLTNVFYGIAYDKFNDKVIALGIADKKYFIQTFNGYHWDYEYLPIPESNYYTDVNATNQISFVSDLDGNYYISVLDYLLKGNSYSWDRIFLLTNPSDTVNKPKQDYKVLFTDSSNNVWVNAYLKEFDSTSKSFTNKHTLGYLKEGDYYEVYDTLINYTRALFSSGIHTKKDVIAVKSYNTFYYEFNGNKEIIRIEDGDDFEKINDRYDICQNLNGDLVFTFHFTSGWDMNYGEYELPGGISIFDGKKWDHESYKTYISENDLLMYRQQVLSDTYGYEYILTNSKFIRISPEKNIDLFVIEEPFFTYYMDFVQIENTIWCSHNEKGLYKFDLPTITSVDEKNLKEQKPFLLNDVVKNQLDIKIEIKNYEIYTISGSLVLKGGSESSIDVSKLSNGLYFIVCDTYDEPVFQKFMVSK